MATKKKSFNSGSGNSKMKFRPTSESKASETKGIKPLPEPASVHKVLTMMVIHVCRKTLFFDTSLKVGVYGACLFLVSLIADVLPMPKSYLSRTDNVFNIYFVKLGWGWTLIMTLPFIVLTSYTYCCGQRERIIKHLMRLCVATGMWFVWTSLFSYIETNYGKCVSKGEFYDTKRKCLNAGFFWHGLDLSGHAFILIYSSLVMIEEARAYIGWETIVDLIRNEEFSRTNSDSDVENSPLRYLSQQEFNNLKHYYEKFTPYIRGLFIGMTLLTVLWDVMLIGTILYHHIMIEKFLSGAIAVCMWFFTYRFWFALPNAVPCLPGDGGQFKYKDAVRQRDFVTKKRTSMANQANANKDKGDIPKFMGMPLYGLKKPENGTPNDNKSAAAGPSLISDNEMVNSKWQPKRQDFFES